MHYSGTYPSFMCSTPLEGPGLCGTRCCRLIIRRICIVSHSLLLRQWWRNIIVTILLFSRCWFLWQLQVTQQGARGRHLGQFDLAADGATLAIAVRAWWPLGCQLQQSEWTVWGPVLWYAVFFPKAQSLTHTFPASLKKSPHFPSKLTCSFSSITLLSLLVSIFSDTDELRELLCEEDELLPDSPLISMLTTLV